MVDGVIEVAVPVADDISATLDQAPPAFSADPERATA
jgi:hypothetical protein